MSHFSVMVIGHNPEKQLEKFNANLEVEEYEVGPVSSADMDLMTEYYTKEGESFNSFDECYAVHGKEWNDNRFRQNEHGTWTAYSTANPDGKWDWFQLGGRFSGHYIRLKPGADGIEGDPGVFGNKTGIDMAYKSDIDIDTLRREKYSIALSRYRDFAEKCGVLYRIYNMPGR